MTYAPPLNDRRFLSMRALELIASGLASSASVESVELCPGEDRRYKQLLETPDYNAWLIAWAPSSALDPHDHGGSRGVVHVLEGRLLEMYVDRGLDSDSHRPMRTRVADAGDTLDVPAHRIHEVFNPGNDVAYSVHVYSPPLTEMEFFEL